jgi:hypothetical protein
MIRIKEYFSYWCLLASYPVICILCLYYRLLEGPVNFFICNGSILLFVALALHASLKMKVRSDKNIKDDIDIIDAAFSFLPVAIILAFAQSLSRDTISITGDVDFNKYFGYVPERFIVTELTWMASSWVIVTAYVGKYHWDALVKKLDVKK